MSIGQIGDRSRTRNLGYIVVSGTRLPETQEK
jgi:hypothetical protein